MKRIYLLIALSLICNFCDAQIIELVPAFATQDDSVTIIYDATKGNAGLVGESKCIAHTGVITNLSSSNADWRYVQGQWGVDFAKTRMTSLGNDKWSISFNIRQFYGVPAGENILKLAFVFHNASGGSSKKGADVGGADIYFTLATGGFQAKILSPTKHTLVNDNDTVNINIIASVKSTIKLFANGLVLDSVNNDSVLNLKTTANAIGSNKIKFIAEATYNNSKSYDTTYIVVKGSPNIAVIPEGNLDGINYKSDTSVLLQLYAPFKNFVYVLGDFNNWEFDPNYLMNKEPGSARYWLQIDGLEKGKEYAFQYVINDEKLRVADMYTEKILDGFNDKFIDNNTYPDLKPYPDGKTTELVSVMQTAQPIYDWKHTENFVKPAANNLIIYELLVRDFVGTHNYQTLKDTLIYLKNLGINAIELMPINEFDGNESWGYNPNFFLALDKYYGTKNALKDFIDECHKNGIAVILDIVLNHAWGLSPQARMYFDATNNQPAANNPWLNQVATHPFNVGYDFNHEAQATKDFTDRVVKYWADEYKIDGYRFDLSKGFTQKNSGSDVGAWGAYDQTRINIWKRIRDEFRKTCTDCYMILEHFADNNEEKVLSDEGFLLWGNLNHAFNQATMGYSNEQDLTWANYKVRNFNKPSAITYAESHDEERLMFKNRTYGNINGTYNVKDIATGLKRVEAAHAVLLLLKGPKMIWQFGELGYDISIDQNGRTGNKPILWSYFADPNRIHLYHTISALNKLKQHPSFQSDNYQYNAANVGKYLKVSDSTLNSLTVANFDMKNMAIIPVFQHTGWWYNYLLGDSINITNLNYAVNLAPGEFIVYTDRNINPGGSLPNSIIKNSAIQAQITAYPNPSSGEFVISLPNNLQINHIEIVNILGQKIMGSSQLIKSANNNQLININLGLNQGNGIYFLQINTNMGTFFKQLVLNK